MEYYLISDAGSDPVIADILGLKRSQLEGIINPGASGLELQSESRRVVKLAEAYLKIKK